MGHRHSHADAEAQVEAASSAGRSGQLVDLVCTGALTNAALLVLMYPEVVPMVAITLMGGAMGIGNTGPVAEFNIQVGRSARPLIRGSTPTT